MQNKRQKNKKRKNKGWIRETRDSIWTWFALWAGLEALDAVDNIQTQEHSYNQDEVIEFLFADEPLQINPHIDIDLDIDLHADSLDVDIDRVIDTIQDSIDYNMDSIDYNMDYGDIFTDIEAF